MSSKQIKGPIEADGSYVKLKKGATTEATLQTGSNLAAATFTLPDSTDTLVGRSTTDTLTNKSIDGDTNTVSDLPITAIKTVLGDAFKAVVRDSSGVPTSALILNANISSSAAIAMTKLAAMTASKIVATDASGFLTPTSVAESDLSALSGISGNIQTQLDAKVAKNSTITGATKTKITYDAKGLVTAGADIAASDLPTGIDAAKIADGSVSSTEFQYLDGATSNLQTQITARATTTALTTHTSDTSNPHATTKTQVGLGNVDNTSDATKNAAVATLTNKTLTSPAITTPTGIVKGDVGLGNVDNTSDATKNAAAVQLTNKDIDGGTASNTSRLTAPKNTLTNLTALTRKQGTLAYDTTSNKLVVDNGTSLVAVGSGSGGLKTYVTNPNDANGGWTPSSAGVTVTTESTASFLPDNASQTTGIKIAYVSGTNPYAYTQWTMDAVDYTVLGQILLDAKTAAASGVFQVELWTNTLANYSGTYTKVSLSAANIPTGTSKFIPVGAAGSSTAPYMELRIVATAAGTLYLNNVTYTPSVVAQNSVVNDAVSWTPTGSWTTNTTYTGQYWRLGSIARFTARIALTGAPTAANLDVNMPTGLTIDSSKVTVTQYSASYGKASISAGSIYNANVTSGGTTSKVSLIWQNSIAGSEIQVNATSPTTFANGHTIDLWWEVPIAEWAGQVMAVGAGARVEYAYQGGTVDLDGSGTGSGTVYSPLGLTMSGLSDQRNKYVVWQSAPQDGDLIGVQMSPDSGASWSETIYPWVSTGTSTTTQGVRYINTTAGVSRFIIGRYTEQTNAWAGTNRVRFYKVSPSAPVGVLVAGTDGTPGYAQAGKLPGSVTGTAIATGMIGEMFGTQRSGTGGNTYSARGTTVLTTASQVGASLTLNKGVYLVSGIVGSTQSDGSARLLNAQIGIGGTAVQTPIPNTYMVTGTATTCQTGMIPVVITADSTVVAVYGFITSLTGASSANAHEIFAVRIA